MKERDKFYRTVVKVTVLSEGEPVWDDLDDLHDLIDKGDCVGMVEQDSCEELSGREMANALYDAASEPGFFRLDDNGNPVED